VQFVAFNTTKAVNASGNNDRGSVGQIQRRQGLPPGEQARGAAAISSRPAADGRRTGQFDEPCFGQGHKKRTPQGVRGSEIRLFGGEGGGGEADTAKSKTKH